MISPDLAGEIHVMLFSYKALNMSGKDLTKEVSLQLPVGHLLIIWDILSNKLAGSPANCEFSEEEKRAIWALEDLCEQELINNGITARPEEEWNQLRRIK